MTPGDTRGPVKNAHPGTPYRGGQTLDVSATAHAQGDHDTLRGHHRADPGVRLAGAAGGETSMQVVFCGPRRVLTPGDVPPSSVALRFRVRW